MICEISKDVFWVGAVDWSVRHFHGHTFNTGSGTTYNAYLILGEKITLIDTVFGPFAAELLEQISGIVPPEKIDYIIANHVETDHSGALPEIMRAAPRAKLFGTAKCREGLYRHYYASWPFQTVKTGDKLSLGGNKAVTFIEAPMLHWPDSMFTYLDDGQVLFSNDAFGQHLAHSKRFADEIESGILMREAAKYYANILWPLSRLVIGKIAELRKSGLPVSLIAPSHGMIWRKDPGVIVENYARWAQNRPAAKAVLVYETMWGGTEKMAGAIYSGLLDAGVETAMFDINRADHSEIIGQMLEAGGYLFGSPTHDNGMLPNLAGFIHLLKGLRPQNRLAAVFGSFGWAGGAVKEIEKILSESGLALTCEGISAQYSPDPRDLEACRNFGREFGRKLIGAYK
ncbi:MAG: flavodoxin domain-containing protein [Candidatus Omnitrophota bacterium]